MKTVSPGTKKKRIVTVDQIRPPKDFTAGTILDRQASLIPPEMLEEKRAAFVKSEISDKAIDIALAFHILEAEEGNPGVPAMIASLVTNDEADSRHRLCRSGARITPRSRPRFDLRPPGSPSACSRDQGRPSRLGDQRPAGKRVHAQAAAVPGIRSDLFRSARPSLRKGQARRPRSC